MAQVLDLVEADESRQSRKAPPTQVLTRHQIVTGEHLDQALDLANHRNQVDRYRSGGPALAFAISAVRGLIRHRVIGSRCLSANAAVEYAWPPQSPPPLSTSEMVLSQPCCTRSVSVRAARMQSVASS
jgi:hypothetical protein